MIPELKISYLAAPSVRSVSFLDFSSKASLKSFKSWLTLSSSCVTSSVLPPASSTAFFWQNLIKLLLITLRHTKNVKCLEKIYHLEKNFSVWPFQWKLLSSTFMWYCLLRHASRFLLWSLWRKLKLKLSRNNMQYSCFSLLNLGFWIVLKLRFAWPLCVQELIKISCNICL